MEYTLSIIKPDAVERNIAGNIISYIEKAGLQVVAIKKIKLSQEQAQEFYAVHRERPFFTSLVKTMTSGPVFVQVLKGDEAIVKYRNIMGATNPANADVGTIRKDFAIDIEQNSVHGSDSSDNAKTEIAFFFNESDLVE